jgi:MarR family transcriptional regulator, organic hydroperoxide resistance regulator
LALREKVVSPIREQTYGLAMSRKLVLQDFLPYLLNRAGLRIGLMFSRDIEPFGVTLPMWRVMIELWRNGEHRLGELSERTSIDVSTLSRLLVAMQRRQLIARRRSGLDGRALSLTLTGRGLELTQRIVPFARRYEELAMQGLSEEDVAALKRLLKTVYRNLEAADVVPAQPPAGRKPRARKRAVKVRPAAGRARSSA